MTTETDFLERYLAAFGDPSTDDGKYQKDSRLAKAYEVALDIRKFEIDNYWKRSSSFWLVVAAIFTALGIFTSISRDGGYVGAQTRDVVCVVLSSTGSTICFAWYLINESSKFWQRNWEYQVDILERKILGPLYKTVFAKTGEKMYSVTNINKFVSAYIGAIFFLASVYFTSINNHHYVLAQKIFVILANICFCIWMEFRTTNNGRESTILNKLIFRAHKKPQLSTNSESTKTSKNDESGSLDVTTHATVRYLTLQEPPRTASGKMLDKLWAPPMSEKAPRPTATQVE